MTAPVVRVRDLVRRFTLRGVLNGLDLDIHDGEFVALLGRSGSGKSTLLRALADLDHESQGSGEIVVPERLSVVFQDARLLPWKRVLDNVTLGLRGANARECGLQALEEVELAGRAGSWPYELSGGEQQRVALARSLVRPCCWSPTMSTRRSRSPTGSWCWKAARSPPTSPCRGPRARRRFHRPRPPASRPAC